MTNDRHLMTGPSSHGSRQLAVLALGAVVAVVLAGCSSGTTAPEVDPTTDGPNPAPSDTGAETPTSSQSTGPEQTEDPGPDSQASDVTAAKVFAADGSEFSIADHAGSTVFVETFATWCHNGAQQLPKTNDAAGQAGGQVVFLVLSVESGLDPDRVAEYQQDRGLDNVIFGILTPEGLAAFNDQFGSVVLNAPSVPKFIVQPDGTLGELSTGQESVEEILAQLEDA
jgi:thiol-disulfide isomerase/thioredoxin